jgi:prevent-host-death family protein
VRAVVNVSARAAKATFSRLVRRAERGEEIIITRNGRPVAKLVPATTSRKPRKLGALTGKIRIAKDFDAALPDDILDTFGDSE